MYNLEIYMIMMMMGALVNDGGAGWVSLVIVVVVGPCLLLFASCGTSCCAKDCAPYNT